MRRQNATDATDRKYRRLREIMRARIQRGEYPSGSRFPTEHEWARQYDLSRYTVRQAQDELEREGYLLRQQGRGTFVQMPPRPPSVPASRKIGVLVPCITFTLYPGVIRGVEDACWEAGYDVIVGSYDAIPEKETRYIARMLAHPVAGLAICPSYNSTAAGYHLLTDSGLPFVLIDTMVSGVDADFVATDNLWAARQGTRRLLETGCRSVVFMSGHLTASTSRERLAGVQAALQEQGMALDRRRILAGDFSEAFGAHAMREFLAGGQPLDGLFVANDPIATGALKALRAAGRRVPEDVRVCTFDDPVLPSEESVPLIVVHQPRREIGRKAGDLLLARIQTPPLGGHDTTYAMARLPATLSDPAPSRPQPLREVSWTV